MAPSIKLILHLPKFILEYQEKVVEIPLENETRSTLNIFIAKLLLKYRFF